MPRVKAHYRKIKGKKARVRVKGHVRKKARKSRKR